MRKLFVLFIYSLISLAFFAQNDSIKVYNWSDLKKYDPDTIYALSFEKLKLEKIPKELEKFKNLKYLDVSKNKLMDLPDFIGNLTNLEYIDISKNKFSIFPLEICQLSKLKVFKSNRNHFESLPECIGFCTELESIDLWDTPVSTFPVSFQNLKNLKELDLQGIKYGTKFQKEFQNQMFWVKIKFDPPCSCMD